MYDLVAAGECLVDFVSREAPGGGLLYEGNPGGAPANVLAAAAKLGLKTALIGKVGDDRFGRFLKATLDAGGVDTAPLVLSGGLPTTLAFVSLDSTGNRSFSFYRKAAADLSLTEREIDFGRIRGARLFHFGSVSLTGEPSRGATLAAVRFAKENGVPVSFDPNLRERLWDSLDEAKTVILQAMEYADIVKVSDDELRFLTELEDEEEGARMLWERFRPALLAVTLGPKGCCCLCGGKEFLRLPTYDVPCVDTTGAGDAFWGALLFRLLSGGKPAQAYSAEELRGFLEFANAAGSLATTKKGAIPALPGEREILDCIARTPLLI